MGMLAEKRWKTVEGVWVPDVPSVVQSALDTDLEIHIGSDSQQGGLFTHYVTVIALLNKGKGGRAVYYTEKVPKIQSLRERLLKEVWKSVEVALEVNEIVQDCHKLQVHIDVNPNVDFKSSSYIKELTALVVSQGFDCKTKPESWAASHLSDHVVKYKVMGR